MEDNRRLILDSVVSDQDAVKAIPNDPQAISASTPADVELTNRDTSLDMTVEVDDFSASFLSGDGVLSLPVTINNVDMGVTSFSNDTRLASNRAYSTLVDSQDDQRFAMTSNLRMADDFLTIVDLYGRSQPSVHYLLREGGSGFIRYENGNRILIL